MPRAFRQMRGTKGRPPTGIGCGNADHPPFHTARAKERATRRTEFSNPPAGIDPLEHSRDECAL